MQPAVTCRSIMDRSVGAFDHLLSIHYYGGVVWKEMNLSAVLFEILRW